MKILVVDGDPASRGVATRILQSADDEVIEAATGNEALQLAHATAPDLMLLDDALPDMAGVEVCRQLKADPQLAAMFVVLISDPTTPDPQTAGLEAGAVGLLTRPLTEPALLAQVQVMRRLKTVETARLRAEAQLEHLKERYRQAETKLRQSEATNRAIIEAIPDLIYRLHRDGTVLEMIPTRPVNGLEPPYDLVGRNLRDLLPVELPPSRLPLVEQALQTGEPQLHEYQFDLPGETRYQEVRIVPFDEAEVLLIVRDITERKQLEQALRLSETKFRTLADTTSAAIFIYQGTKNRYVNPAAEMITGYSQAELLAMDARQIVHPDFQELVSKRMIARQQGDPVPERYKIKLLTKDGTERWVDVAFVLTEFEGKPAVLGTAFDITHSVQLEAEQEQLLRQEREQRLLAETLGGVFLTLAAQTSFEAVLDEILLQSQRVVAHSAANIVLLEDGVLRIARWCGYQAFGSEALLATLEQTLPEFPLDQQVIHTCRPLIVSDTHQNPDWVILPETAWIRSSLAVPICLHLRVLGLLRLDSDEPHKFRPTDVARLQPLANAAAIALENARLHQEAQQEIDRRIQKGKELRRAAAKNQALLDAIPDSMFHISRAGQLLGYKIGRDSEILADALNDIEIGQNLSTVLETDLLELVTNKIEQAFATGAAQFFEYQLAPPLGPQNFEIRLVVSGPDEVLAIVRNITKRKQAERRLIQAERLAALGQLMASLAHEMNNPLQVLRSFLDLLLKHPLTAAEKEEILQTLSQQLERLNTITQRVLTYASPKPIASQRLLVTEQLQQTLALTNKQFEHCHIRVTTDFLPDTPAVEVVPDDLTQILLDLLLDAAESIPPHGQLHLASYVDANEVVIAFTNYGRSIPAVMLDRIFEPFATTKAGESGMRLWICHRLAQQNGGSLTAHNLADDQGVVFMIRFPQAPPS